MTRTDGIDPLQQAKFSELKAEQTFGKMEKERKMGRVNY